MSTLDGSLHALSKQTGDLKWTLKDGEQGAVTLPSLDPELGAGGGGSPCMEDKCLGSRLQQASLCSQLHHFPAVWPWESHFAPPSLNVLTCKMGPRVMTLLHRVLGRIKLHACQVSGSVPGPQ